MNTPITTRRKPLAQKTKLAYRRLLIISVAATAAVVGGAAGSLWYGWSKGLWALPRGDQVSKAEQQKRIKIFTAMRAMPLAVVGETDVARALISMHLAPTARDALLAELSGLPRSASRRLAANSPASSAAADAQIKPAVAGERAPQESAATVKPAPLKLAWVTLWDTDMEDGDAVRIESGGYARTVVLTKRGLTFAVPIPPDGQIRLMGVRDGDGGGITVGLASGAAKVVLPVMSVGEGLILNVRVP